MLIEIEIHSSELVAFDHGCGVSAETLTRLGKRFYRPAGGFQVQIAFKPL